MQNTELTIHPDLETLLPRLTDMEFAGLEESILKDGCLSALVVWNSTLIDGHHRYEICRKHQIPFSVRNVVFESPDDAKLWIWKHQENRRNLTAFQRAELALKLKDAIAAKAKERQRLATDRAMKGMPLPGTAIETNVELGKLAGVSRNTISKVEYLLKHTDNATQERLRKGEKGTSIHREYCRLRSETEPTIVTPRKVPFPKETSSPKEWVLWLLENQSIEFVYEFIESFFANYQLQIGDETTKHLLLKLCNKYIN
jgi:ParB-like chromosome segregation protein Spo0J